jgi:hypothetical protein
MHIQRTDRGSTLPFLILTIALVGAIVVLLGRVGGAATARAGARSAADAAALAGAANGRAAAVELAQANGAELLSYQEIGLDTEVRVRLGPAEATGRAQRSGDRDGGPGGPPTKGLAAAMRAALARAEQLLGRPVPLATAPPNSPGTPMHERGLAIDVPPDLVARMVEIAPKAGLCQPFPADHPAHFEVCR